MTLITGTFKDSGQVAIASGVLRAQLNAPLPDDQTTPDSYLLTIPADFAITNGVLATCNLKESETAQISYTFTVLQAFTDYDYYYAGTGEYYTLNSDRPSHLHTDSKYYTGVVHTVDSVQLERVARTRLEVVGDAFQAIVPNQSSVEFAQLERTGFATDRTPQTARQVARVLQEDPLFTQALIDFLVSQPYVNTQPYRKGNIVAVGGSSYQAIVDNVVGQPPASSPTYWRVLAAKGDAGGTGGNDTAFGASWDGDLNAPSKNAVYDYVNLLAPKASPVFTGTPTAPTAASTTVTTQIATTAFVDDRISARFASPAFTGTPTAPTQADTTNSTAIATTAFTKNTYHRYSRVIGSFAQNTAGGASVAGVNTRTLNTISVNAGDVVSITGSGFTLRAGTYRIRATGMVNSGDQNRLFLWNNTSSARILTGINNYAGSGQVAIAQLTGTFTIASNTDILLRHYITTAKASDGLGVAVNESGVTETFSVVELWRLD